MKKGLKIYLEDKLKAKAEVLKDRLGFRTLSALICYLIINAYAQICTEPNPDTTIPPEM